MHRRRILQRGVAAWWSALLLAFVLTATACGGGDDAGTEAPPPESPGESTTTTSEPTTTTTTSEPTATTTTSEPTATTGASTIDEGTSTTSTTVAVEATPSSSESSDRPGDEEQTVMDAWAVVFDSSLDISAKLNHLDGAASLEASNAAYAAAGERMGGISLEPTAAEVDGDSATVTYNVLFGATVAYEDLSGTLQRVDGSWVVSRESYCGFLASARTRCQ